MTGTYNIKVRKANLTSASYDALAALDTSDAVHIWTLNAQDLTTSPVTVMTGGTYGEQNLQTSVIRVPATAAGWTGQQQYLLGDGPVTVRKQLQLEKNNSKENLR